MAQIIFPTGNSIMHMYDHLGMRFRDADFADLFPHQGQPAEAPVRLALVTMLQFWEGLTDRQAADAVRTRIDWTYVRCLELTDLGFDGIIKLSSAPQKISVKVGDKPAKQGSKCIQVEIRARFYIEKRVLFPRTYVPKA